MMNTNKQTILEERLDENYEPLEEEVKEFAKTIGLDPEKDAELLWIAREGIHAPLPPQWKPCQDKNGDVYYFNFKTGISSWEHPCDEFYRGMVKIEKEKLLKSKSRDDSKNHGKKESKAKHEILLHPIVDVKKSLEPLPKPIKTNVNVPVPLDLSSTIDSVLDEMVSENESIKLSADSISDKELKDITEDHVLPKRENLVDLPNTVVDKAMSPKLHQVNENLSPAALDPNLTTISNAIDEIILEDESISLTDDSSHSDKEIKKSIPVNKPTALKDSDISDLFTDFKNILTEDLTSTKVQAPVANDLSTIEEVSSRLEKPSQREEHIKNNSDDLSRSHFDLDNELLNENQKELKTETKPDKVSLSDTLSLLSQDFDNNSNGQKSIASDVKLDFNKDNLSLPQPENLSEKSIATKENMFPEALEKKSSSSGESASLKQEKIESGYNDLPSKLNDITSTVRKDTVLQSQPVQLNDAAELSRANASKQRKTVELEEENALLETRKQLNNTKQQVETLTVLQSKTAKELKLTEQQQKLDSLNGQKLSASDVELNFDKYNLSLLELDLSEKSVAAKESVYPEITKLQQKLDNLNGQKLSASDIEFDFNKYNLSSLELDNLSEKSTVTKGSMYPEGFEKKSSSSDENASFAFEKFESGYDDRPSKLKDNTTIVRSDTALQSQPIQPNAAAELSRTNASKYQKTVEQEEENSQSENQRDLKNAKQELEELTVLQSQKAEEFEIAKQQQKLPDSIQTEASMLESTSLDFSKDLNKENMQTVAQGSNSIVENTKLAEIKAEQEKELILLERRLHDNYKRSLVKITATAEKCEKNLQSSLHDKINKLLQQQEFEINLMKENHHKKMLALAEEQNQQYSTIAQAIFSKEKLLNNADKNKTIILTRKESEPSTSTARSKFEKLLDDRDEFRLPRGEIKDYETEIRNLHLQFDLEQEISALQHQFKAFPKLDKTLLYPPDNDSIRSSSLEGVKVRHSSIGRLSQISKARDERDLAKAKIYLEKRKQYMKRSPFGPKGSLRLDSDAQIMETLTGYDFATGSHNAREPNALDKVAQNLQSIDEKLNRLIEIVDYKPAFIDVDFTRSLPSYNFRHILNNIIDYEFARNWWNFGGWKRPVSMHTMDYKSGRKLMEQNATRHCEIPSPYIKMDLTKFLSDQNSFSKSDQKKNI